MSANGAFSSTLDFEFFGGGYLVVQGGTSGPIEPTLDSTAKVLIVGESTNNSISFSVDSSAQMPGIFGQADLSFDFSANSFVEFGIQTFGKSEWINRVEFSANSVGYVPVKGSLDQTLDFTLETNIYVYSEGDSTGSFGFSVTSKGTNNSTHTYDREGANGVKFDGNDFNGLRIPIEANGVRIIDNGMRQADIIQR